MKYFLLLCLFSTSFIAQSFSIMGTVSDHKSGDNLAFANLYINSLQIGSTTDDEGKFIISNLNSGSYSLKISFVGYETKVIDVIVESDIYLDIRLKKSPIIIPRTVIEGTYPKFRETSVAFSEINREDINYRLGSREVVNVLRGTPSAYISNQGGGIGEQRLNLRGFDQTNIAVMINGIPINNPENGEIYWSNWVGISDLIEYIHVQRGLGAIPYSTSSIGGSVNFVTIGSGSNKPSYKFNEQFGSNNLFKSSLSFSTKISENVNLVGLVSRRTSDGYADQVYSDEYNYYLSVGLNLDRHMLQIQVLGSPQKHGQRLTPLRISEWKKYGKSYNADWGYLNGKPLNLRDNEFHNPTVNIKYSWAVNNNIIWNNIVSLSRGSGGGTVPPWYPELTRTENGLINFDREWQINSNNIDPNYDLVKKKSIIALRKGVHKNYWSTIISSLKYNWNDFIFSSGVDFKLYEAQNYNEISNLLGGDYTIGSSNINADPNKLLKKGDKVDFYADSFTRSYGSFFQAEYKTNKISAYLNLGITNTEYNRLDYFYYQNSDPNRETGWKSFVGNTIKAGLNYNVDNNNNFYFNIGSYSRAPLSMNVYDYGNNLYENVKNENIISFEGGYGFKADLGRINLNYFYTIWDDKAFSQSYLSSDSTSLYYYNIFGAAANHRGIELDGELYLAQNLTLSGMLSYSDNRWTSDVDAYVRSESNPSDEIKYHAYTNGLKVGNYPMTTISIGLVYETSLNSNIDMYINPIYNFYGRYYSKYFPELRTNPNEQGIQPWRIPDFSNIDLNSGFKLKLDELFIKSLNFSFNIFNLFNSNSIIDAIDGIGHNSNSARVWYGSERWWSASISVTL